MHQHFSDKTVHRPDWPFVLKGLALVLIFVTVAVLC